MGLMRDSHFLTSLVWLISAFGLSAILTSWLVRKKGHLLMMDIPNARSLHQDPVPRGGGLAIVAAMVCSGILIAVMAKETTGNVPVIVAFAALLAAVGWLDDRKNLPVLVRLSAQIATGIGIVTLIGAPDTIAVAGISIPLLAFAGLFWVLWIVWMVNLFNFMDGIDGLAAQELIVAGGFVALWFWLLEDRAMFLLCIAVVGGAGGFALYNWSPAKIFMGDVGSLASGGLLGAIALVGVLEHDLPWSAFLILYGLFFFDATATLLRRVIRRERWWEAHSGHYYQRLVHAGWSHARVARIAVVVNLILGVLATADAFRLTPGWLWLTLCLVLLGALGFYVRRQEARTSELAH